MSRRARLAVFLPAAGILGFLLVWAVVDLPSFGHYRGPYGYLINAIALPERHMTNAVTAVVFDYRGFDTMGEEFILFVAVMGVVLLLRKDERESGDLEDDVGSDAIRVVGVLGLGACMLVGLWLIAFGFITPGGGFQGGAAVAASMVLLFVVSSYRAWSGFGDERVLDPFEGIGAGGYVVVGLAALIGGLPFLTNFWGPGVAGTLWSGGSAPLVNWAAGMEVAAANLVLFSEFLKEYIVPVARGQS